MDVVFGVIFAAFAWLNDKTTAYVNDHPFWCLFFGIIWVVWHLEKSIHRRLDAISAQLDRLEDRERVPY
jgi:hypothetical protein